MTNPNQTPSIQHPSQSAARRDDQPGRGRPIWRRLGAAVAGVSASVAAATVLTLGSSAPASAATNDYMSDPDCANNGIPAEIVTRAIDGWRFSASCHTSYGDVDGNQVSYSSAFWDGVYVSDADVSRSAHIRYMCPEEKAPGQWDQGTLRGFAEDGTEVFRVYPSRAGFINGDARRCSNDN